MSLLAAFVLAFAVATPARADGDTKKAAPDLQGEWKFLTFNKLGRDSSDIVEKGKVTIADDKLIFVFDDESGTTTFTLDPKAEPPAIDIKSSQSKKVIRGIYKLDKDKLTICFGIENSARPTEFKPGKDDSLLVLEKVKK